MLDTFTKLCSHKSHHGILVLGEGNFSFSVDLAEYENKTSIFVTSYDSVKVVHADDFAVENVTTLKTFNNVTVKHSVDATHLEDSFPDTKFSVIIFNFPHTGGKSNIKKCRKLLDDFFRSSLACLCNEGRIIISLCKGQGGTPVDASRGNYGNSWKVVSCASKSGYILRDMIPFDSSNLKHYRTAGYRGVIRQNFFTMAGLVHIFQKGVDIDASYEPNISELKFSEKLFNQDKSKYMFDRYMKSGPNILYESMETIISISVIFVPDNVKCMDLNKDLTPLLECDQDYFIVENNTLLLIENENAFFQLLPKLDSFKLSYYFLNHSSATADISPLTSYISHQTIFSIQLAKIADKEALKDHILEQIQHQLFKHYQMDIINCQCGLSSNNFCNCTHKHSSKICKPYCKKFSDEKGYEVEGAPNFIKQIPVSFWTNFEPEIVVSTRQEEKDEIVYENKTCEAYELNKIENKYFDISLNASAPPLQFKNIQKILIGGLCVGCLFEYNDQNGINRLMIKFFTNELFVAMGVQDLRYLWSDDEIFKMDLLATLKNGELNQCLPLIMQQFNTLIKHPLCYRHDLCFWLDNKHTEHDLMESISLSSHNFVHSVRLIKVLRHEESNCVSYCYRMIYARLDGPLSHEDSVQLQNKLRLFLLDQGYDLR